MDNMLYVLGNLLSRKDELIPWHIPGDYNKITIGKPKGPVPHLPNEILIEIFGHFETREKFKGRLISGIWNVYFKEKLEIEERIMEYCEKRNRFRKDKHPCTCRIDRHGHFTDRCND